MFSGPRFAKAADAHLALLEAALALEPVESRGMRHREILGASLVIEDPRSVVYHLPERRHRHVIGVLEGLQLLGQVSLPEAMTERVRAFGRFLDRGVFHGAYGARIAGQLDDLVRLLERDPGTRQAVLTIYDAHRDLDAVKRDVPCTLALQFLARGGELHLRIVMRSNDLWLGFPYDVMQFAMLQAAIASHLGLELGRMIHQVGSLHLYERDVDAAFEVIESGDDPVTFQFSHLWRPGWSVEDSSRWARLALMGEEPTPASAFEAFVLEQLKSG